jgi:hypothetical protein
MSHNGYGGPVFISTAVWGFEYTDFFINYCMPALLAPGNIPALAARPGSRFILHTTSDDLQRLEAETKFADLKGAIELDARLITDLSDKTHSVQALCHADAIRSADEQNVPMIFISPDTLWSDGTFRRLLELLQSGKRVAFVTNFRATKEDVLPALHEIRARQSASSLSLSGREVTRLALDYLHPSIEENFFGKQRGEKLLPCNLIWELPNGDLLARSFHCHPLMVFPRKRFARFDQTIDGDLVRHASPDEADWHIVTDSDEMTCVEISKRSHFIGGVCEKEDIRGVAEWALKRANHVHWSLFAYPVRIHASPVVPAYWATIEKRAADVATEVYRIRRRLWLVTVARQAAIAGISRVTGLAPWEVSERRFRIQWAVTHWGRSVFIRRIQPIFKDPIGWLLRRTYGVFVYIRLWFRWVLSYLPERFRPNIVLLRPRNLDDWAFRLQWNIKHAFLSFYRRRIRAFCLYPIEYIARLITQAWRSDESDTPRR